MQAVMPAHSRDVERYTPRFIFEGLKTTFDLDPCAPLKPVPASEFCRRSYCLERGEDGFTLPWDGLVWLNPPWTRGEKRKWIKKLARHGSGVALVRGGVDSAWLHDFPPAALLLLRGRVGYLRPGGEPERPRKGGAVGGFEPSMLLAYGAAASTVLLSSKLDGLYVKVLGVPYGS